MRLGIRATWNGTADFSAAIRRAVFSGLSSIGVSLAEPSSVIRQVIKIQNMALLCTRCGLDRTSIQGLKSTQLTRSEVALKPPWPLLSAMSYCHMSLNWCSEAVANAVGGKCISYVGGDLCLCLLIQAGNCCCDRGC